MRLLYVVEVLNEGVWKPEIGFAERRFVTAWMEKHVAAEKLADTSQWRIVQYIPAGEITGNGQMN
jgi:hypothetical protein